MWRDTLQIVEYMRSATFFEYALDIIRPEHALTMRQQALQGGAVCAPWVFCSTRAIDVVP